MKGAAFSGNGTQPKFTAVFFNNLFTNRQADSVTFRVAVPVQTLEYLKYLIPIFLGDALAIVANLDMPIALVVFAANVNFRC